MPHALGVDATAQAVYTAMVDDPSSGVEALAERLGVGETEIREALDTLVEMALLRRSREQADKLIPVPPAVGLQYLMQRQEEELAARRQAIEETRATAARLIAEQAAPSSSAEAVSRDTEHLIGADAIQDRLDALVAGATVEVLSLVPGGAVPAEALDAAKAADTITLRRGVKCRIVYQDAIRNDPPTLAYGLWLAENGAEVRTTPILPQRLLLADRRAALVPLDPTDPWAGRVHTTNPGLIDQLVALFEQVWGTAAPLAEPRPVDLATGLTTVERSLLQLLASGVTDEAAAKRLGISTRTVRRIMADLMDRLGAGSRFEAGIKAAQRGWL